MPSVTEKLTPQTLSGPRFHCKIPESARQLPTDPKEVVFQLPSTMAEIEASDSGLTIRMTYELIERSVVEMDGKQVDQAYKWLDNVGPKVRQLLVRAFNKITLPTEKEAADFLRSLQEIHD